MRLPSGEYAAREALGISSWVSTPPASGTVNSF